MDSLCLGKKLNAPTVCQAYIALIHKKTQANSQAQTVMQEKKKKLRSENEVQCSIILLLQRIIPPNNFKLNHMH